MGNYDTRLKARMAQTRKGEIIERLGGRCENCQTRGSRRARNGFRNVLEIEHVKPRKWRLRNYSQMGRVRIYEREEKRGLLKVLCSICNRSKGDRTRVGPAGRSRRSTRLRRRHVFLARLRSLMKQRKQKHALHGQEINLPSIRCRALQRRV